MIRTRVDADVASGAIGDEVERPFQQAGPGEPARSDGGSQCGLWLWLWLGLGLGLGLELGLRLGLGLELELGLDAVLLIEGQGGLCARRYVCVLRVVFDTDERVNRGLLCAARGLRR